MSASAAAFVGFTSLLAPLRIALTIATTVWADKNIAKNPWFIKNIASRFKKKNKEEDQVEVMEIVELMEEVNEMKREII